MKRYVVFFTDTFDGAEGTTVYHAESSDEVRQLFMIDYGSVATLDYIVTGD